MKLFKFVTENVLFLVLVFSLLVSGVGAQDGYYPAQQYQPVPAYASGPQYAGPQNLSPMGDWWRSAWPNGIREEWKTIHEIRPIPEYENMSRPMVRPDGFYYYPRTGCWQRDLQPYCPQQSGGQWWTCPSGARWAW